MFRYFVPWRYEDDCIFDASNNVIAEMRFDSGLSANEIRETAEYIVTLVNNMTPRT